MLLILGHLDKNQWCMTTSLLELFSILVFSFKYQETIDLFLYIVLILSDISEETDDYFI